MTASNRPGVEIHLGFQHVHAGKVRGRQAVYRNHGVHPAQQQRQPLPVHRVGPYEVRWGIVTQSGGCYDALAGEVAPVSGRQTGRAVAHPLGQAILQQGARARRAAPSGWPRMMDNSPGL